MKQSRESERLLHRVRASLLAVVALIVIGTTVGAWALLPVSAQQPQRIAIQVEGRTIWLESGKNVHPQTYEFLAQDPGPDWYANTIWKYVDGLWVPLALGSSSGPGVDVESLPRRPTAEGTPLYDPDCRWTRNVPIFNQHSAPWGSQYLYLNPACKTMAEEGCAITSAAMVFKYFGVSTDPGVLNTCLGNLGIHSGTCGMAFDLAAADKDGQNCDANKVTWVKMWSFNPSDLCRMLAVDRPPIVEVDSVVGDGVTHWVVVYSSAGVNPSSASDYRVLDPWDGSNYKTLAVWAARYRTAEYRRG